MKSLGWYKIHSLAKDYSLETAQSTFKGNNSTTTFIEWIEISDDWKGAFGWFGFFCFENIVKTEDRKYMSREQEHISETEKRTVAMVQGRKDCTKSLARHPLIAVCLIVRQTCINCLVPIYDFYNLRYFSKIFEALVSVPGFEVFFVFGVLFFWFWGFFWFGFGFF